MFQFPAFASKHYVFMLRYRFCGGFPHSDIHGSKIARISPWLFAACCVLLRLPMSRHPPNALLALAFSLEVRIQPILSNQLKSCSLSAKLYVLLSSFFTLKNTYRKKCFIGYFFLFSLHFVSRTFRLTSDLKRSLQSSFT